MQVFGKIKEIHDLEYITKCYVYLNEKDEQITNKELDVLLKKKNKNVLGTIFLYNPSSVPIGYDKSEKLSYQEYKFTDDFVELQIEDPIRIIAKNLKKQTGKLIEVKYLFNYNKEDIQPTTVLEIFDMDLEKLHTNLLTVFAKNDNFHDFKNISYNGKFIFFAWGHKFDRHHTNISTYAGNIALWARKTGKEIGFLYDGVKDEEDSYEYARFIHPVAFGKLKLVISNAIATVFSKDIIKPYRI